MAETLPPLSPDALKSVLAFKFLSDEDRLILTETGTALRFDEGEPLIEEGELSTYLYAVLEGSANVSVARDGKDVYVSILGAGEIVGEAGLFINIKRTARVAAGAPTTVFRIDREAFLAFLTKHPGGGTRVLMVIIYGLLKKLREANQELAFERKADVSQSDIDDMVAQVLLKQ